MTKDDLRRPLRAARRERAVGERERLAALIAVVGMEMPAIRAAACVALYASLPDEPGTGPLREALRAQGIRVLLPVVPPAAAPARGGLGEAPGRGKTGRAQEDAGREAAHGAESGQAREGAGVGTVSAVGAVGAVGEVGGRGGLWWGVDDGGPLVAGAGLGMPEPGPGGLGPEALGEADVVVVPALGVDAAGNRLGKGRGYYDAALTHAAPGVPVVALLFDGEVLTTPIPAEDHDVPVTGVLTPSRWMIFSRRPN